MSRRIIIWVAAFALIVVACGSGSEDADTPADTTDAAAATTAASSDAVSSDTTAAAPTTTTGQQPSNGGGSDGSDIDWASVDLATIDWANLDLSTVDWQNLEQNPTVASIDQATQELIGSRLNPGSSTVTIGDMTYEFATFLCAFGSEATESDIYSFSAASSGPFEDTNVQLSLDIADDSGAGRLEGSDVEPGLEINDLGDFENPAVSWFATEGEIMIDGYDISFDGVFDDMLTEGEVESIPVSFTGRCGDQSRDRR